MEDTKDIIVSENIQSKIYVIRGLQVMLDQDLADIYGYEVKALNQQVKRNISRFPEDFMFQLSKEEAEILKSQFVTSSWGGNRKLPYAFTEQGIYMLATVLRGELAERQSIFIMRAFRELRHFFRQNQQLITRAEMNLLTSKVTDVSVHMGRIDDKQKQTERKLQEVQKKVEQLSDNFITKEDFKSFVIYKGQKFEADIAYVMIYQQAKKSIFVVDNYLNTKSLQLLSQKTSGVEVILFTENGNGGKGFLTKDILKDFEQQYPPLQIKPNPDCHDRLIVLDYGEETEKVYHCGASSKDAGKKLCAINSILDTKLIHPVIEKLLKYPDKQI